MLLAAARHVAAASRTDWCAGHHARDLLTTGWPHELARGECPMDDHMIGTQVMGIPVLEPDARPARVDTVLISSRRHEATRAGADASVLDTEVQIVGVDGYQSTDRVVLAA